MLGWLGGVAGQSIWEGSVVSGSANVAESDATIWWLRRRNAFSSKRFLLIHAVTSSLHLLSLQDLHDGTTLVSVYRPPLEMASTQSFWRAEASIPQ